MGWPGFCGELFYDWKTDKNDEAATLDEFIDEYVEVVPGENDFTLRDEDSGISTTKKVKAWLQEVETVPYYFACSQY